MATKALVLLVAKTTGKSPAAVSLGALLAGLAMAAVKKASGNKATASAA